MRKKFCCEATRDLYENYYVNQSGGYGIPVFQGSRVQRGHGIGSILGGLFRSAFPLIKRGLAKFGRHALKTGLEIANDMSEGAELKESAKRRVGEGIKRFASQAGFNSQQGSGAIKRRKTRRRAHNKKRKKKTSRTTKNSDIFA